MNSLKKVLFITIFFLVFGFALPTSSFAQSMMGFPNSSPDNASIQSQQQEEQEGKKFLDDLSNKTVTCSQLNDANFEKIGEYFMGQSIGDTARHITMNEMMKRMMGDKGEEQVHTAWGKRGSGCDASASYSDSGLGVISMMRGGGNSMMNFGFLPFGGFGWIFMILWWVLIIVGVVALIKWITEHSRGGFRDHEKSALEILKERYAKGEIGKKEFEEKKKDLR